MPTVRSAVINQSINQIQKDKQDKHMFVLKYNT